uniref:NR LBD domain-containing protein n=1 Tax=Heligmosomoides polygyrus TaxID=6339 RepID=A0A183FDL5_HELPZ
LVVFDQKFLSLKAESAGWSPVFPSSDSNETSLESFPIGFAEWLMARWAMVVDRRFRIPPPPAKQTVNNPYVEKSNLSVANGLLVADSNLTKHENIRKMVVEVRTWLPQAVASLEKFIADAPQLVVPLVPCFLSPFLEVSRADLEVIVMINLIVFFLQNRSRCHCAECRCFQLLTDDSSVFRRSRMWRQRAIKNTSGQLQVSCILYIIYCVVAGVKLHANRNFSINRIKIVTFSTGASRILLVHKNGRLPAL